MGMGAGHTCAHSASVEVRSSFVELIPVSTFMLVLSIEF